MAPALGKRKRRDQIADLETSCEPTAVGDSTNMQALFRQHFESHFEPLPSSFAHPPLVHDLDTKTSDEELESDWDGFSEHGEEHTETVHYPTAAPSKADVSKDEFKTFMVRAQIVVIHQYYADFWVVAEYKASILRYQDSIYSEAKKARANG